MAMKSIKTGYVQNWGSSLILLLKYTIWRTSHWVFSVLLRACWYNSWVPKATSSYGSPGLHAGSLPWQRKISIYLQCVYIYIEIDR